MVLSREIHQLEARATLIEEEVKRDSPLEHNPGHEMSSAVDVSMHSELKYASGMYASEFSHKSSAAAAGRSARARIARLIVATCRVALSAHRGFNEVAGVDNAVSISMGGKPISEHIWL